MRIIITFLLNAGLNFGVGLAVAAVLGPAEYGRYAVGASAGALLATAFFDWLRLSTTRFYGEAQRCAEPNLRRTLDRSYAVCTGALVCLGVVALTMPWLFGLSAALIGAVVLTAVSAGAFDFRTALARARFRDKPYTILVIGKGAAALLLALGAGSLTHDPATTLAAQAVGALVAILPVRASLAEDRSGTADHRLASRFAAYGVPIVTANVVFQGILLLNRSVAAARFGYEGAGHLSLSTDIELRLFLAVGAAVDVLVFQLAVRSEAAGGQTAAQVQLRDNMVHVVAVVLLLAVGFAGALPAFTALVVPTRFRAGFEPLALAVLPGIVLFCIGQFAINPVFQMARRTAPIIAGAVVSAALDVVGLCWLPDVAGPLGLAAVHSVSLGCGFVLLAAVALRDPAMRPRASDMLGIVGAAVVTLVALWPTRWIATPVASLIIAAGTGLPIYVALLAMFDVGDVRAMLKRCVGRGGRRAGFPGLA